MLAVQMLSADRRRFFMQTRGGVYFPIGGAIFWLLLGVGGFLQPPISNRTLAARGSATALEKLCGRRR